MSNIFQSNIQCFGYQTLSCPTPRIWWYKNSLDYILKHFNRKRSSFINSHLFSSVFSTLCVHGSYVFWSKEEVSPGMSASKTSRDLEGLYVLLSTLWIWPSPLSGGKGKTSHSWNLSSGYLILFFGGRKCVLMWYPLEQTAQIHWPTTLLCAHWGSLSPSFPDSHRSTEPLEWKVSQTRHQNCSCDSCFYFSWLY